MRRLAAILVLIMVASLLPGAEVPVVVANHGLPEWSEQAARARAASPAMAALLLVASLPLLFLGWRLLRPCLALAAAAATFLAVDPLIAAAVQPPWALVVTISLAAIAAALGFFLFQGTVALLCALASGAATLLVLRQYWPDEMVLRAVVAAVVGLLGAWLGWRAAPVVAVIETVLVGAALAGASAAILAGGWGERAQAWSALAVIVPLGLAGLWVQCSAFGRQRAADGG